MTGLLTAILASAQAKTHKNDICNRVGVCTSVSNMQILKDAGGNYGEISISSTLIPEKSDEEFAAIAQALKETGLPITSANGFFPGDICLVGPNADQERALRYTEIAMRRAEEVGLKTAVLGSGTARRIPDGFSREKAFEQFADLCRKMAPIAKKHGVTIVVEPLRQQETNFINSVLEGMELVKAVKHPNFQVLADIYHMTQGGESPQSIIIAGKHLRHVHIAENANRTPPGTDGDDFTPYLEALKRIHYRGKISIECGWKNFKETLPGGLAELRRQLSKVFDTK